MYDAIQFHLDTDLRNEAGLGLLCEGYLADYYHAKNQCNLAELIAAASSVLAWNILPIAVIGTGAEIVRLVNTIKVDRGLKSVHRDIISRNTERGVDEVVEHARRYAESLENPGLEGID